MVLAQLPGRPSAGFSQKGSIKTIHTCSLSSLSFCFSCWNKCSPPAVQSLCGEQILRMSYSVSLKWDIADFSSKAGGTAASQRDSGDKIMLPVEVLEKLSSSIFRDVPFPEPLLFELNTPFSKAYVSVLEFTAPPRTACLPLAIVEQLGLDYSRAGQDELRISLANLPKAKSVKLQPLSADFQDITDVKSFLESSLRGFFSVLQQGQLLSLTYEGEQHQLLVAEIQPFNPAVSGRSGGGSGGELPTR